VSIPAGSVRLVGDLVIPPKAPGVVAFAHGSGSGRHSPRNRLVAAQLQEAGLATLLLDLLTEKEEWSDQRRGGDLRFDIPLLAGRLEAASGWLAQRGETAGLKIGYFGASTGAAAALVAAGEWPVGEVAAIVSRGGRPDLADRMLPLVTAPTLLIVGSLDSVVLELNRQALERLTCEKELVIVPGATHLFEEPGALEEVARLAVDWFRSHFA
jgi:putative phosphoribosyl transferase